MLDAPRVIVAELVGHLDLLERPLERVVLALVAPRPRELELVEDPEFHPLDPWNWKCGITSRLHKSSERIARSCERSP